jgi:hypothetical protein
MGKRMAALLLALILAAAPSAWAYSLCWNIVTHYTDGTPIGDEAEGIFYTVEMDGEIASFAQEENLWMLPITYDTDHTFRVQTVLGNGAVSVWTEPLEWTSPSMPPPPEPDPEPEPEPEKPPKEKKGGGWGKGGKDKTVEDVIGGGKKK